MEEDWGLKTKRRLNETSGDLEEIWRNALNDMRRRADDILEEEKLFRVDEEELSSLQNAIKSLKTRMEHQETHGVNFDDDETSARLGLLQMELQKVSNENKEKAQALKDLVKEVVELEHDKENQVDKMTNNFNRTMKQWKIYKAFLDLTIVFESPDVYKIGFSSSKGTPTPVTLRTTDLKSWEVLKVEGNPGGKEELVSYLTETGDFVGLMCKARAMFKTSSIQSTSLDIHSKPLIASTKKVFGNRNF